MKMNVRARGVILIKVAVLLVALVGASSALCGQASVSVSPAIITDQGEEAIFTINISPPSSRRVAVKFALSGTAVAGRDYVLFGDLKRSRIVFLPGQPFATVTLHSFDGDGPSQKFASLHIVGGERYSVGSPSHATVKIENVP